MKIISTVPSLTELLFDLDLEKEVVGITKFCIHPNNWFKTKERIGGTKTLDVNKIISLKPDLIICNKEENTKEQIEELMQYSRVFVSDVKNLIDNYKMINKVGIITRREEKANLLIEKTKIALKFEPTNIKKSVYLIWKDPYMTIGHDTFIHSILNKCGFENIFKNHTRYPIIDLEKIHTFNPEYILLSSEPFPFKEKHVEEIKTKNPNSKVILIDGEAFSWYGSRLMKKASYLKTMSLL